MATMTLTNALWWSRHLARMSWVPVAQLIARIERRNHVVAVHKGAASADPILRVAILCHFDRAGRVREPTRLYLEALRNEGLSVAVVTNAGWLAEADLAWLRERTVAVIIRRNIGYDFAAWRDALIQLGLPRPDTQLLLLTNDSMYGPFTPLGATLARFDFGSADVWGLTDSWQHRFHLQSYLLAFGPRALTSKCFANFWKDVRDIRSKWGVIKSYEIGLTQYFMAAGLRCQAAWPYMSLVAEAKRRAVVKADEQLENSDPFEVAARKAENHILRAAVASAPMNPTTELWRLLLDAEFPFLKRELLRENPARIPDIAAWGSILEERLGQDTSVVIRDLERCLRHRTP